MKINVMLAAVFGAIAGYLWTTRPFDALAAVNRRAPMTRREIDWRLYRIATSRGFDHSHGE
jgi:hypothetical protein